jgi:hypothetical protein
MGPSQATLGAVNKDPKPLSKHVSHIMQLHIKLWVNSFPAIKKLSPF